MITLVDNIALGTHPVDTSINLLCDVVELSVNLKEVRPYAKLGLYIKHIKTVQEGEILFKDLDKFVELTLDNVNQYPDGQGGTIGDLEYFLLLAKAGTSIPNMCTPGIQAAIATIISKMGYTTVLEETVVPE